MVRNVSGLLVIRDPAPGMSQQPSAKQGDASTGALVSALTETRGVLPSAVLGSGPDKPNQRKVSS